MNARVTELRERSIAALPSISAERSLILTRFYREHLGRHSTPVLRALAFRELCERKTITIEPGELIVGERGPAPKATPLFPELTCHSTDDLRILDGRPLTSYDVPADVIDAYEDEVIPYWRGRSLRDRLFEVLPREWHDAYEAGLFTEFMEQRAPGHTVADGKIYARGMEDFAADIDAATAAVQVGVDPRAARRLEELRAMRIAAHAAVRFAERHAELAERLAAEEPDPARHAELERIAAVCRRVPAGAPGLLGGGPDVLVLPPGGDHGAQRLGRLLAGAPRPAPGAVLPARDRGRHADPRGAKELLGCLFVKFNNHPAPPKVGVTAAESGTYTDFAGIALGGIRRDGTDGVGEVSYLLLEVIDELHLVQPSPNVQLSRVTPEHFLRETCRVVRKGYGYPALFNADGVVTQLLRKGKSVEDAREGGTSGCVETGAYGKEAYVLTGYFNLPKILELTLHDGRDPRTGRQLGPRTGDPRGLRLVRRPVRGLDDAAAPLRRHQDPRQRAHRAHVRRRHAGTLPLAHHQRLHREGHRLQRGRRPVQHHLHPGGGHRHRDRQPWRRSGPRSSTAASPMDELLAALDCGLRGPRAAAPAAAQPLAQVGQRRRRRGRGSCSGVFETFVDAVDGRPNVRGGTYGVNMLPTTCHVYFGSVTGATPDGRRATTPLSEGISPVQGADRLGPTAVLRSAAKMDQARTCGTLLNMKVSPGLIEGDEGIAKLSSLVRTYFRLGGHHIQFNVVSARTLREAQAQPDAHRDLIVRVAGYSDYFCDLSRELQDEIIARTEHEDV